MKKSKADRYPLTAEQRKSDDWNPLWDTLRDWDPDFVEAYLNFRSSPRRRGPLTPKVRELIMIAINASTTHLYAPGLRRHIQNALREGATRAEVLEAIQLTTVLGIHACNLGVPILAEEWAKHASQARSVRIQARKSRAPVAVRSVKRKRRFS
ncbi:MAG: carboxymuconolactone decarboxylase family protein [Burkholderiales bacterium]|nr:carboxymuconolactone decarboxylase family protein [Burkholderiales bacterium]